MEASLYKDVGRKLTIHNSGWVLFPTLYDSYYRKLLFLVHTLSSYIPGFMLNSRLNKMWYNYGGVFHSQFVTANSQRNFN